MYVDRLQDSRTGRRFGTQWTAYQLKRRCTQMADCPHPASLCPLHGMAWHTRIYPLTIPLQMSTGSHCFRASSPQAASLRWVCPPNAVAGVGFAYRCSSSLRCEMALETMQPNAGMPSGSSRLPCMHASDLRHCFAPGAVDLEIYITTLLTEPPRGQRRMLHSCR
jgi:hypothetical protein